MSRTAKVIVLVLAAAFLVGLFLILRPRGEPPDASPSPAVPPVTEVDLKITDGKVEGPKEVNVPLGSQVEMTVTSDVADEIHVHGYDVMTDVEPGKPAAVMFTADAPGVFEVELEDEGLLLIEVSVSP